MRKLFPFLFILLAAFNCQIKEQSNIDDAILKYMLETLDNPKSYNPISTSVIDTIYNFELIEEENEEIENYKYEINVLKTSIDDLIKDVYYYDYNIQKKDINIKNPIDAKRMYLTMQNKIIRYLPKKDQDKIIKDSITSHFALETLFLDASSESVRYNTDVFLNIYKPMELWKLCYKIIRKNENVEDYNEMIKDNHKTINELNKLIHNSGPFSYNCIKIKHEFRATNKFNAVVKEVIYFNYDSKFNNLYKVN